MKNKAYIIHGWDGFPEEAWFPWMKKELEARGFEVIVPQMPEANAPKIEVWVPFLQNLVGVPDEHTYFIGHSIGCQTVLRFLETLNEGQKIGGVVFVAGWLSLSPIATKEPGDLAIAMPWLTTPIDFPKIKTLTKNFVAIFSDDDPFVPVENEATYLGKLGAEILHVHAKGHIGDASGVKELPIARDAVLKMAE